MPQPSGSELYVDRPLTGLIVGYKNNAFIADMIFPRFGVDAPTGIIPKVLQSQWFRNLAKPRTSGSMSTRSGFGVDLTATYLVRRYSHGAEVLDDDRSMAAMGPFDLDRLSSQMAVNAIRLKRELLFAADLFAASKGWTDKTGSSDFTQWDDYAASNPGPDVDGWKDAQEALIGAEPRKMVMGKRVASRLRWHPQIVDIMPTTQLRLVTAEVLKAAFDLDEIMVGRAIYTTSAQGTAEASVSYTRIWGNHALLLHAPAPGEMVAPAGYKFVWQRVPNADEFIKRMRREEEEKDIFEANSYLQYKQIDGRAGTFALNAVAS